MVKSSERPTKPKLFEKVRMPAGIRFRVRKFHHNEQLRTAMQDYADALSPEITTLKATVVFDDDSEWELSLRREEKSFSYKDYVGEVWEQVYNGKRWVVDDTEIAIEGTVSASPRVAVLNYLPPESVKEVKRIEINHIEI